MIFMFNLEAFCIHLTSWKNLFLFHVVTFHSFTIRYRFTHPNAATEIPISRSWASKGNENWFENSGKWLSIRVIRRLEKSKGSIQENEIPLGRYNKRINQSINQSVNQSINQSINKLTSDISNDTNADMFLSQAMWSVKNARILATVI